MTGKLRSSAFVTLLLVVTCVSQAQSSSLPSLSAVLKAAQAHDFDRAINLMTALDDAGVPADRTLVQLLNYYLGAGPSEVLAEAITKRGARVLPQLRAIRAKTPTCLRAFVELCEDRNAADLAARNDSITRLIGAIEAHKILRAGD